jgi:hypothetical protein
MSLAEYICDPDIHYCPSENGMPCNMPEHAKRYFVINEQQGIEISQQQFQAYCLRFFDIIEFRKHILENQIIFEIRINYWWKPNLRDVPERRRLPNNNIILS